MTVIQRYRILKYSSSLALALIVLLLILSALQEEINFYVTPLELLNDSEYGKQVKLGGFVKENSLIYLSDLEKKFMITDGEVDIEVYFTGTLPNLFRNGQGLVLTGMKIESNIFKAKSILAKHDADYRPPGVEI